MSIPSTPHPSTPQKIRSEDQKSASTPEGRPATPGVGPHQAWMLLIGLILALLAASIVVMFVWGAAAAGLTFVFGAALAFIANPVIWASVQRDRPSESERTDQPRE